MLNRHDRQFEPRHVTWAALDSSVARVSQEDIAALRTFLRRRFELSAEARRDLGYRIVVSLASRLDIPALQMSQEAVLEEIDRQVRLKLPNAI